MEGIVMKPPGKVVSELNSDISCSLCGKVFQDYSNCRKHTLRHGQMKGNECEICHKLFQGKQQKLQHVRFEHGKEGYEFKCEVCGSIFESLEKLHEHSELLHPLEKHCTICYEIFTDKHLLKEHIQTHIDDKSAFKCEVCGKCYRDRYTLNIHMRHHTGEKPFECPHCNESFMRRMYLFRHVEMKHTEEMPYHCALCNVSFKTILQLRNHVKRKVHQRNQNNENPVKTVEKNYVCQYCSKAFSQQSYLTLHLRIHTLEKHYFCPVCSRGFVQVGNMHQHIKRVHHPKISVSDSKKKETFECQICHRTYNNKRSLKYHMKGHKTNKKQKCKHCSKSFDSGKKLQTHQATHDNNSDIKCHGCSKVFFSMSNLNRHMKNCTCVKSVNNMPVAAVVKEEPLDNGYEAVEVISDTKIAEMNDALSCVMKIEGGLEQEYIGMSQEIVTSDNLKSQLHVEEMSDGNFVLRDEKNNLLFGEESTDFPVGIHVIAEEEISTIEETIADDDADDADIHEENQILQEDESSLLTDNLVNTPFSENNILKTNQLASVAAPVITDIHQHVPATQTEIQFSDETDQVLRDFLAEAVLSGTTEQSEDIVVKTEPHDETNSLEAIKKLLASPETNRDDSQIVIHKIGNTIVEVCYVYGNAPINETEEVKTSLSNQLQDRRSDIEGASIHQDLESSEIISALVDQSVQAVPVGNPILNFETDGGKYSLDDSDEKRIISKSKMPRIPRKISKVKLICSICQKEFGDKSNLRQHEKRHNQNKSNECSICNHLFQGSRQVIQHKMTEHGIKETYLSCEICNQEVTTLEELQTHRNTIHGEEYPFECTFCFKRYKLQEELDLHFKFHMKPFPCDQCEKSYDTKHSLAIHQRLHYCVKSFQCDVCGMSFTTSNQLSIHAHSHQEKPLTCSVCGKDFTKQGDLEKHMQTHNSGEKVKMKTKAQQTQRIPSRKSGQIYNCTVCSKTFNQKTYLTIHMRTHTGEHPYFCPICGKTFVQNGNMQKHVRTHVNKKKPSDWIKCDVCDALFRTYAEKNRHTKANHSVATKESLTCKTCFRVFQTEKTLAVHMNTHETFKNLECSVCHKFLRNQVTLRKHEASHLKPSATCSICNLICGGEQILKVHMERQHNSKNKFECPTCRRRYPDKKKLEAHRKSHWDKPHRCNMCEKSYYNHKSLRDHIFMHTAEREHACDVCHKLFINAGRLRRHMKIHIKEEEVITDLKEMVASGSDQPGNANGNWAPGESVSNTLTNTGGKPNVKIFISKDSSFECLDCKERFTDNSSFLKHVKSHTAVENK